MMMKHDGKTGLWLSQQDVPDEIREFQRIIKNIICKNMKT
jgi:hypothetical protein